MPYGLGSSNTSNAPFMDLHGTLFAFDRVNDLGFLSAMLIVFIKTAKGVLSLPEKKAREISIYLKIRTKDKLGIIILALSG